MKKLTLFLSLLLFVTLLITSLSIGVCAANDYYEQESYMRTTKNFMSPVIFYNTQGANSAGYKYTNSSCPETDAYFIVSIRRYKSEDSIFYSTKGTSPNNPANLKSGIYKSYDFKKVMDTTGCYHYHYNIKKNNDQYIYAKPFIKYQYTY